MGDGFLKEGEVQEFIGQIIDIFEDFLTDRKVTLNNPEIVAEIEAGVPAEGIALIYGSDYGDLQTALENMLGAWGVI